MRNVVKGSKGSHVLALQTLLVKNNIRDDRARPISIDGCCGTLCEQAIRTYQKSVGLVADGKCEATTWGRIMSFDGMHWSKSTSTYNIVALEPKHIKNAVITYYEATPGKPKSIAQVWSENGHPTIIMNAGMYNNRALQTGYGIDLSDFIFWGKTINGGNYSDRGFSVTGNQISSSRTTEAQSNKDRFFIGGSPSLIYQGNTTIDSKGLPKGFLRQNTYKTGLGKRSDGSIILISTNATVDCYDLQAKFLSLGATDAINLDGGGSTQMGVTIRDSYIRYTTQPDVRKNATYLCIWMQ